MKKTKRDAVMRRVLRDYKRFADLISAKEAVALRKAAIAFAKHEPSDSEDRIGVRLNDRLMRAAIAYAEARK